MINEAHPDTLGDGLINFDKRRKEFELLAQIKLLQVRNFQFFCLKNNLLYLRLFLGCC